MIPIDPLQDSSFDIEELLTFCGDNYKEKNLEGDAGWPIKDGQSAAKTLIINHQASVGETERPVSQHQATHDQVTDTEKTQHSVSQYQANHDQAARPSSKKRGGTPLDDDEKRIRKRLVDKNHREKMKQNSKQKELEFQASNSKVKDLESELQASNRKVKDFERKEELWNEERNSMAQKIGRLKSKNRRLKEDGVGEILKELRGVKMEVHKLKGVHASSIVEEDMSKERLQREDTYSKQLHLKTREDTYNSNKAIRQQQALLENMFLRMGELPMKQEQLRQEENGQLGFVGDGRLITTGDVEELKSMMMTQFGQLSQMIDALKTPNPPSQAQDASIGPQRMDALETPNPPSHAPCASTGHRRFSSSSYNPRDGKNV
ncbi:uncharacterized protein LOC119980868 isoform X2 [Tripterygium wilfordii]|uniref:uncharacterized protein LOC119980868 isoform X2 n=1 Tax=Tripterygium wilfordii TaxID=458696 RepID=UPI0018F80AE0|nr:uncharacterized protein LOC119980868 isoform X2 [Tripterygium wilfordii]